MRISDWSSDGSSADLADVLIDDHALAIDNEGFRHAGRTQRDLYAAVHVRSDAGIRIAPSGEETIQILPAIPNGDTVDRNARFFQDRELRCFGSAGHAPAREYIKQARLALLAFRGAKNRPTGNYGRNRELRPHFRSEKRRVGKEGVRMFR